MRLSIPLEEWILIKSKTEELPFGHSVTEALDAVTFRAEAIPIEDIAGQKLAWANATKDIYKAPYGAEIFQELLLMLVTTWQMGEWFFQEVLSPLEQTTFYAMVDDRMNKVANK